MFKKLRYLFFIIVAFHINSIAQIPANYQADYNNITNTGLNCYALKNDLSALITNGQTQLVYGQLDNTQIPATDTIQNDAGNGTIIWDLYANHFGGPQPYTFNSTQTYPGGFCGSNFPTTNGVCWNKEHTFPKSWFKLSGSAYQQPAESDLFIVRPTDGNLNSKRSNSIYSVVGSPTSTFPPSANTYPSVPIIDKYGASTYPSVIASNAVEPSNAIKGDLARAYFYIVTRYQSNLSNWVTLNQAATDIEIVVDGVTNSGTYPSLQLPYLKMLYQWHIADPVDAREIQRNNLVYEQQNNRNPFVDHPEYVALMFQCTGVLPVTLISFEGKLYNQSTLLQWYATQETTFKKYVIERSTDGNNFNEIDEVTGQNLAHYTYEDAKLPYSAVVYYRIKMVDIDGKFTYSKIIAILLDRTVISASIFPNPATNNIRILLSENLLLNSTLVITDAVGKMVKIETINASTSLINSNISTLSSGRYFVKIMNAKQLFNQSFVVVK